MNEMPSDGKPTDTGDTATPRRASNLRIGLLALVAGIALGLAADGALRVQTPQGEREVRSADVSLRLAGTIAPPVR